jgi:hypothetical protein
MKLPDDGPECGPKHVAAVQWKQFHMFTFYRCADGQSTTNHQDANSNDEAPHYAFFSNLLLVHPSSPPCSQTPSVYVPPLMQETKFRTHTEPQAKL